MPAASCSQAPTSYTSCLPPASPKGGSRRTSPRQNENSWHSMDYLHTHNVYIYIYTYSTVAWIWMLIILQTYMHPSYCPCFSFFACMRLWKEFWRCAATAVSNLHNELLSMMSPRRPESFSAHQGSVVKGQVASLAVGIDLASVIFPVLMIRVGSFCKCLSYSSTILHSYNYSGSSRRPVVGWDSWMPKVDQQDDATLVRGVLNRMLERIVKDQTFPLLPCPRCLISCYNVATFWYDQTQMASETNVSWTAVCPQLCMGLQQREQSFTNAKAGTFCSFSPRSESVTRRRTSLPVGKAFLWVSQQNNLTPLSSRD